jgi:hypothetical protein
MANAEYHGAGASDFESVLKELFQRAASNPDLEHESSSPAEPTLTETLQRDTNPYNLKVAGGISRNQRRNVTRRCDPQ